jgi:hypothetical protein
MQPNDFIYLDTRDSLTWYVVFFGRWRLPFSLVLTTIGAVALLLCFAPAVPGAITGDWALYGPMIGLLIGLFMSAILVGIVLLGLVSLIVWWVKALREARVK